MLLIRGTTSLLLSAHASKKLRTSPALTPWAERHLHGMCTQYRCTGPGYVVFSDQNDIEGARRTLFHTIICPGISTGAVISVVGELISIEASRNHSNRGRPKTERHYPHPPPSQTKMRRKQKRRTYRFTAFTRYLKYNDSAPPQKRKSSSKIKTC